MKVAGIVLAGGKSSRFGRPKMFERYKGKMLYEYSLDALRKNNVSPLILSTNHQLASQFEAPDTTLILEEKQEEHQGPLFALYKVMAVTREADWFFVLSSDTPFLTSSFVEEMIDGIAARNADVLLPVHCKRLQPLAALYHSRCFPALQAAILANKKSMMALLDEVAVRTVHYPEECDYFININRPEDWQQYLKE